VEREGNHKRHKIFCASCVFLLRTATTFRRCSPSTVEGFDNCRNRETNQLPRKWYLYLLARVFRRRKASFDRHTTVLRECIAGNEGYRFVIHDRDRIYSHDLDTALSTWGLTVLKTPYKAATANAICERWIGSARRECLDFMIPISGAHIRQMLKCWVDHYNRARPHSSLGPGTPDPSSPKAQLQTQRHCIPKDCRIVVTPILARWSASRVPVREECYMKEIAFKTFESIFCGRQLWPPQG
jgi:Integrase core domain